MKALLSLLIVICGVLVWQRSYVLEKIERTPPHVAISGQSSHQAERKLFGLGNKQVRLALDISDNRSGIGRVIASLIQGETKEEIFSRDFSGADSIQSPLEIELPAAPKSFSEGEATLEIIATDRSLWKNSTTIKIASIVDRSAPRISVLSLQHIVSQAGAEFVVYSAQDSNLESSGVSIKGVNFPGYPLNSMQEGQEFASDLYGVLFAIPFDFSFSTDHIEAYAIDKAGNKTSTKITSRLKNYTQNITKPNLGVGFLNNKVPELLPGFEELSGKDTNLDLSTTEGLLAGFKLINEDYRVLLDQKLTVALSESSPVRRWTKPFIRPMPAALSSNFGEKRFYQFEGQEVSYSVHLGLDLASVQRDSVVAVNDGVVKLTEDLGIYGNSVLIDHGIGLFSLYSHLSEISVAVGEEVTQGKELGRSGVTGLAGGDHLHFEFRVHTQPVLPIEWWDAKWIEDHVDGKIRALLQN